MHGEDTTNLGGLYSAIEYYNYITAHPLVLGSGAVNKQFTTC